MTSTLREPARVGYGYMSSGRVRADANACELMCVGQILHMFGLLDEERFTLQELNRLVGRNYGDPEIGKSSALLYEHGLVVHSIGPNLWADVDRWVESYDTWLHIIQEKYPDDDVQDNEHTRDTYRRWLAYINGLRDNRDRYSHLITNEYREPLMADIDWLLDDGQLVAIAVEATGASFIDGLVCGKQGVLYLVYHPEGHLVQMTADQILAVDGGKLDSIAGWKLPS